MNSAKITFLLTNLVIFFLSSNRTHAQWTLTGNTPAAGEFIGTTDASNFRFRTNNTERMVILSGGNIGIGITNPTNKLDIDGMVRSTLGFTIGTTVGGTWDVFGTHSRFIANSSTDAISISTSKNLSSIRLQVNNGSRGVMMDGTSTNFLFMGGSSETLSGIGNANGSGNLTLLYSTGANLNTEGARLTSTGNFLVGTSTNGAYKLDVNGSFRSIADAVINSITVGRGNSSMSHNTAVGTSALAANTTGNHNTAIGHLALMNNTTGSINTAIGTGALLLNTTGSNNTAIGSNALQINTTGINNTAVGYLALQSNESGSNNTTIGYNSLKSNTTGNYNSSLGRNALAGNTTGESNTAVGYVSLAANTTGGNNTSAGYLTLSANTTGQYNTAFGAHALKVNTAGNHNVAIGLSAGSTLTSGDHNIFIGSSAGPNISVTSSNQLNIGNWIYGNNGNIGIGVSSPSARLHSNGTVRFEGLSNNNALTQILASDALGNVSWRDAATLAGSSSAGWALTGNAGTNPATDFIGTTDVQPVVFKVSNSEAMRFNTDRSVNFLAGSAQLSAKFSTDNYYGNWVSINDNSVNSSAFSGIRLAINETNKVQIFHNADNYSQGGSFDVLSGNAEMLSRGGDVYLSTGTFRSNGLIVKNGTGNVGIGNTAPSYKIDVNGTARFGSNTLANSMVINSLGDIGIGIEPTPNIGLLVKKDADATVGLQVENVNTGGNAFAAVQLGQDVTTAKTKFLNIGFANSDLTPYGVYQPAGSFIVNNGDGGLGIAAYSTTGNPKMRFYTGNDVLDGNMRMIIDETGKVGIGTTSLADNNYKLFVETGIRTRKVKVDQAAWPDYVFYTGYKLPTLKEVEAFIQKNKHLQGMPSALEVEENGLDLGNNQAALLKKIEELTLYLIELNKKMDKLSDENDRMKKELETKKNK
jgi:trimeric autotransporter adhesin